MYDFHPETKKEFDIETMKWLSCKSNSSQDSLSILADVALVCANLQPSSKFNGNMSQNYSIYDISSTKHLMQYQNLELPKTSSQLESNKNCELSNDGTSVCTLSLASAVLNERKSLNIPISSYEYEDEPLNLSMTPPRSPNENQRPSHRSTAKELYICPECNRTYSTSSNLARHR